MDTFQKNSQTTGSNTEGLRFTQIRKRDGRQVSEALNLPRDDVDLANGVLLIAETKFRKSRLVPLDPSASKALGEYAEFRDQYQGKTNDDFDVTVKEMRKKLSDEFNTKLIYYEA